MKYCVIKVESAIIFKILQSIKVKMFKECVEDQITSSARHRLPVLEVSSQPSLFGASTNQNILAEHHVLRFGNLESRLRLQLKTVFVMHCPWLIIVAGYVFDMASSWMPSANDR